MELMKNAEITSNHLLTLNLNYFKLNGKLTVTDNPKTSNAKHYLISRLHYVMQI